MTSILDAEDCWDIVKGDEGESALVEPRTVERVVVNEEEVTEGRSQLKDFQKRRKKTASLITQTVDDSIVMALDVCERDFVRMWQKLAADYNKVTGKKSVSEFQNQQGGQLPTGAAAIQRATSTNYRTGR